MRSRSTSSSGHARGSANSLSMLSVSRILNRSSPQPPDSTRVRTDGPARSASNAAGRSAGPAHTASRLNSGSRLNIVSAGTGSPRSSA